MSGTYDGPPMSQAFVDWLAEHDAKVEAAVGEKVAQAIEAVGKDQEYGIAESAYSEAARVAREVTGGAA